MNLTISLTFFRRYSQIYTFRTCWSWGTPAGDLIRGTLLALLNIYHSIKFSASLNSNYDSSPVKNISTSCKIPKQKKNEKQKQKGKKEKK
jgi:hypothetical protein